MGFKKFIIGQSLVAMMMPKMAANPSITDVFLEYCRSAVSQITMQSSYEMMVLKLSTNSIRLTAMGQLG
jgi:hypothetical protein